MKTFKSLEEINNYGLTVEPKELKNINEILKEGTVLFDFEMMEFTTENDEPICEAFPLGEIEEL